MSGPRRHAREEEYVAFVATRRPHLRRVAYAVCGDWHAADDILQTALTKLYVAWPRVRRDGNPEAYVRRIIVRTTIDESRRPWRREIASPDPALADSAADTPAAGDPTGTAVDDRTALFAALQELPEMQRKVAVLRHWLDLSVAETAQELRIAEGTVKSYSSRALERLRRELADRQG